jgi:hypothetical protein
MEDSRRSLMDAAGWALRGVLGSVSPTYLNQGYELSGL